MKGFESRFLNGRIEISASGAVLIHATANHVPTTCSLSSLPNGVVRAYWENNYIIVVCVNGTQDSVYYYYISPDEHRYVQADRRQDGVTPREIEQMMNRGKSSSKYLEDNSDNGSNKKSKKPIWLRVILFIILLPIKIFIWIFKFINPMND